MAAAPVPPPDTGQGPGPGGGFSSPAPPVNDPGAAQLLKLLMTIVSSARMIATKVPGATNEVRQINDLVAQIQGKVKQQQPQQEPAAPPV